MSLSVLSTIPSFNIAWISSSLCRLFVAIVTGNIVVCDRNKFDVEKKRRVGMHNPRTIRVGIPRATVSKVRRHVDGAFGAQWKLLQADLHAGDETFQRTFKSGLKVLLKSYGIGDLVTGILDQHTVEPGGSWPVARFADNIPDTVVMN